MLDFGEYVLLGSIYFMPIRIYFNEQYQNRHEVILVIGWLEKSLIVVQHKMAGHPIGQLFSKLHEAFASPGGATHRLVIDRRTIEKTWKYMDKVIKCLER